MTLRMDEPTKGRMDAIAIRRTKPERARRATNRRAVPSLPLLRSSALLLALLLPLAAAAQPADERLPDLTPRTFEIVGDLQISLPNLERQPLRGFAPPPRTYVVPGDRQAFVAPYGQPLDGLPADPLAEPAPPQVSALAPLTGRIDAAAGRYLGRLGRLTLSSGGLGLDVSYAGFSGFQPFGDDDPFASDFSAASDVFDGHIAYTTRGPIRVGFSFGGDYRRYHLLGARDVRYLEPPLRTGRTVGGAVSLAADQPERLAYDLRAGFSSTDVSVDDERPGFDLSEARAEAEGGIRIDRFRLDAGGAFAGLGDEGLGESLAEFHAGGALRLAFGTGDLEIGAGVLGYSASEANGGGSSQNVGPIVRFESAFGNARLFARAAPRLEGGSLAALFRENPYAVPQPTAVAPNLYPLDGTGGIEIQGEMVRFTAYGGATWGPVHRYYHRLPMGTTAGLYEVRHEAVTIVRVGGAATLHGPGGLAATVRAEGRRARLDGGGEVYYYAPLTGSLSLALPFADARGLLQLTGTAEGARPTEDPDEDAAAWATLDAEATYRFSAGFGALLRAERLAGRAEQWPGFPRPPATLLGGLRVQW